MIFRGISSYEPIAMRNSSKVVDVAGNAVPTELNSAVFIATILPIWGVVQHEESIITLLISFHKAITAELTVKNWLAG